MFLEDAVREETPTFVTSYAFLPYQWLKEILNNDKLMSNVSFHTKTSQTGTASFNTLLPCSILNITSRMKNSRQTYRRNNLIFSAFISDTSFHRKL